MPETTARSAMRKSALNDQGGVARTRSAPDITRKYVLGTVYELISEHGIESLSMRQVAEATGLSTGTINYHFGNKRSLLIAAFESAYALPVDWEQYRGSPSAQLRRLALAYVFRWAKDRFWRFWINYLAFSTRDEQMLEHQKNRYARQERFWTQLIADGIASGEFRNDLDAAHEAGQLLCLANGLLIQQLIMAEAATRTYARDTLNAAMDRLLAG
jgi:AcrR family transcriptional regulator